MNMLFDLTGKVCFVTGGAQPGSIGEKSCIALAENGAKVAIADIQEDGCERVAAEIRAKGGEAIGIGMNLASNDSIQAAIEKTVEAFGGIDVVVNSAGILGKSSIEDMDREGEWNRVIDIDLGGTFFVCQKALPYLKKSEQGRIINIASVTGRNGGFSASMAYAAAKGGVVAITRGMARHLAPYKITVNAICPGTTATAMVKNTYNDADVENQLKNMLLGRLAEPEEIAAAVVYYASTESGFVTGNMHDINGGGYFG